MIKEEIKEKLKKKVDYNFFLEKLRNKEIVFNANAQRYNPTVALQWRISVILIFFEYCCVGNRSSFPKLQVFYAHLSKEAKLEHLVSALRGDVDIYQVDINFDPTLLRVLNFMLGYSLIGKERGGRFKLTKLGEDYAREIISDATVFVSLKQIIFSLKKSSYSEVNFKKILDGANS